MVSVRVARIIAVGSRELARASTGRKGWGLLFFALALLVPAGALRLPGAAPDAHPVVSGTVPPGLVDAVIVDPGAATKLEAGPPVIVRTRSLAPELRRALAQLEPEPAVRLALEPLPLRLPGRALLVALLAISMLTGPLAETLPGERESRTLEVLLSSSLSRLELVVGKWGAWTLAASAVALLAGVSGMLTGAISPGAWLVAMPAALGVAVALGLWLVRGAGDLVGGAAVPMRVLPVVAVGSVVLAWGLGTTSPLLGAAVPLGGALVAASGLLEGLLAPVVAVSASLAASGLLLWATARSLDRQGVRPAGRSGGALGPLLTAALSWWLAVAGPGVFAMGGATEELAPPGASVAAGGLLLALLGGLAIAREGHLPRLGSVRHLPRGLAVGLLLAASVAGWATLDFPVWAAPLQDRLEIAAAPLAVGILPALLVAVGQELLFRGVLQARLGLFGAVVAWVVIIMPMDPLRGALIGLALGLLQRRLGLVAAVVAHVAWVLGAGTVGVQQPLWLGLLLPALACGLALTPAGRSSDGS